MSEKKKHPKYHWEVLQVKPILYTPWQVFDNEPIYYPENSEITRGEPWRQEKCGVKLGCFNCLTDTSTRMPLAQPYDNGGSCFKKKSKLTLPSTDILTESRRVLETKKEGKIKIIQISFEDNKFVISGVKRPRIKVRQGREYTFEIMSESPKLSFFNEKGESLSLKWINERQFIYRDTLNSPKVIYYGVGFKDKTGNTITFV